MWPFPQISVLRSMSPASILINFWIDKPESKESVQESVQGIKRIRWSKESKGIKPKHPSLEWLPITLFTQPWAIFGGSNSREIPRRSCSRWRRGGRAAVCRARPWPTWRGRPRRPCPPGRHRRSRPRRSPATWECPGRAMIIFYSNHIRHSSTASLRHLRTLLPESSSRPLPA